MLARSQDKTVVRTRAATTSAEVNLHDRSQQECVSLPALWADLPAEFAGHRLRQVRTRSQLVEKILIFEEGLDDVYMELFKALM